MRPKLPPLSPGAYSRLQQPPRLHLCLPAESGLLNISDDGGRFSENPDEGDGQLTLELQRGNPPARSSLPRGFLQQTAGT